MSGKSQTITISEEEYRRLHEADMKIRFSTEFDIDARQQILSLRAQVRQLEKRLAAAGEQQKSGPSATSTQPIPVHNGELRQRLGIAARLVQKLQEAGYRNMGYQYTDSTRATALLCLVRADDGSQITLVVQQNDQAPWNSVSKLPKEQVLGPQNLELAWRLA